LQVVDVTFVVEQILLLVALDLNSAQTFLCEVLGVIDVNDVFHILAFLATFFNFAFNLLTILTVLAEVLLSCLLLECQELALSQIVEV